MYVSPNFKSKKALRLAIADGQPIRVWQPNADITGAVVPTNGTVYLEGPHYPEPHQWYAQGTMQDGKLVKVR
jgi:hypothetical protein